MPSLIDSFFADDMWDPFGLIAPRLLSGRRLGGISVTFPKVDVEETKNEIKVIANIPGVDPEKIDVEVGDDYISLSGRVEKEEKEEDSQGRVYRYEREFGEFRRGFSLPARVNRDDIVARSKNGVLTITLPKLEEETKKRVHIDVEE